MPNLSAEDRARLAELARKATKGPWYAASDPANDCPSHAGAGLALVDTGRHSDWPIARLAEWNNAPFIAACRDAVPALRAQVAELREALEECACVCEIAYVGGSPRAVKCPRCRALSTPLDERTRDVAALIEAERTRCIGIVEYSVGDPTTREKTVARIREGHEQHTNSAARLAGAKETT